jgi:hypothetical protein
MTSVIFWGIIILIAAPFLYIIHKDLEEYADSLEKDEKTNQDET